MPEFFKTSRLKVALISIGSALITVYLLRHNLSADWGIIDDHRLLYFIGPDGILRLSEIPEMLINTEITRPGLAARYRPSYFLLVFIEGFLWGDSVFLWYFSKLLLFFSSVAILWWLVSKKVGVAVAFFFTLSILTLTCWVDIYTRLGPHELYAVFGAAIYALGFINILYNDKERGLSGRVRTVSWLLILFGAAIAMGVKENLLILLLPTAFLFIVLLKRRALSLFNLVCLSLTAAYGLFIGGAIVVALSKVKVDIYQNQVEVSGRMGLVGTALKGFLFGDFVIIFFIFLLLAFVLVYLYLKRKGDTEGEGRKLLLSYLSGYIILFTCLAVLYISQYVFYNGSWPVGNRYDFPGLLAVPFFYLSSVIVLLRLAALLKLGKSVGTAILVIYSLVLIYSTYQTGFKEIKDASMANAYSTKVFSSKLSHVVERLSEERDANLVLVINDPIYFEHLISIPRHLRVRGLKSDIYLWLPPWNPEKFNSQQKRVLARSLDEASLKGTVDAAAQGIRNRFFGKNPGVKPIGEFYKSKQRCYSISFVGPAKVPGCTDILN